MSLTINCKQPGRVLKHKQPSKLNSPPKVKPPKTQAKKEEFILKAMQTRKDLVTDKNLQQRFAKTLAAIPEIAADEWTSFEIVDLCNYLSESDWVSVQSSYPYLTALQKQGLISSRWSETRSEERGGARTRLYRLTGRTKKQENKNWLEKLLGKLFPNKPKSQPA
ncbi:MAG: PadR family transcriptional regulator [Candidatus Caenarcaniphilales bacterium]|nr:PadR family transcriptional regulator [Candidatus Caenarcaniphilales bacterium]